MEMEENYLDGGAETKINVVWTWNGDGEVAKENTRIGTTGEAQTRRAKTGMERRYKGSKETRCRSLLRKGRVATGGGDGEKATAVNRIYIYVYMSR
jgi:hypothetical protein